MGTLKISDGYALFYRNGTTIEYNYGNHIKVPAQRDGYFRKTDFLLLHFYHKTKPTDKYELEHFDYETTLEEFIHIFNPYNIEDIKHRYELEIENVDPWICFGENYRIVVYFGKDKPVRKTKSSKNLTKHKRRWAHSDKHHNWGNNDQREKEYVYWDVKEPDKLVVCGYSNFEKAFPEVFEKYKELDGYRYSLKHPEDIEPFRGSDDYEYDEETVKELIRKQEEEKRKKEEYERELNRRKHTPGYCSRCGCEGADYVANPYYDDMYGETVMEWLCRDCYYDIMGDI